MVSALISSVADRGFQPRLGQTKEYKIGLGYGVYRHFQQYCSYIVAVSFIGGVKRSTRRKPPTCRKSLTNFIT